MYSDTLCSQCGLTLAAIALLTGVVRDLRRTRATDDSYRVEICPFCGEVTGVYDDEEGWAMGHRAPVVQDSIDLGGAIQILRDAAVQCMLHIISPVARVITTD